MRKAAWILLFAAGCENEKGHAPAGPPAATIANAVKEGALATVMLTPESEARLKLQLAPVEKRRTARTRHLGGTADAPPGSRVVVSAPLAGSLSAGPSVAAGQKVAKAQALFSLVPVLTPDARASLAASRVRAEGDAKKAGAELEAAKVALARAEQLLKDKAGPQKAVDEAKARFEGAQASLKAAEAQKEVLGAAEGGTPSAVPLASPLDGVILAVHAAPGQAVAAGAPVFEVAALERIWIRVPVYVGEAATIDLSKEARVTLPGAAPGGASRPARPAAAPPAADEREATSTLVYEMENRDGLLRPGERVGVVLPVREEEDGLAVPWSSVLHDIHGGTWIYEKIAPLTYARRRVDVRAVEGGTALLARGPAAGSEIVSVGAAELFGTEFFVSK